MPRNSLEYRVETEESHSTEDNAKDLVRGIVEGRLVDGGVKDILLSEIEKRQDSIQERIELQWAELGRRGSRWSPSTRWPGRRGAPCGPTSRKAAWTRGPERHGGRFAPGGAGHPPRRNGNLRSSDERAEANFQ